jgi:hypothetical protein
MCQVMKRGFWHAPRHGTRARPCRLRGATAPRRRQNHRDCTIQNPWPNHPVRVTRNGLPGETMSGDRITFKTTRDETLIRLDHRAASLANSMSPCSMHCSNFVGVASHVPRLLVGVLSLFLIQAACHAEPANSSGHAEARTALWVTLDGAPRAAGNPVDHRDYPNPRGDRGAFLMSGRLKDWRCGRRNQIC